MPTLILALRLGHAQKRGSARPTKKNFGPGSFVLGQHLGQLRSINKMFLPTRAKVSIVSDLMATHPKDSHNQVNKGIDLSQLTLELSHRCEASEDSPLKSLHFGVLQVSYQQSNRNYHVKLISVFLTWSQYSKNFLSNT